MNLKKLYFTSHDLDEMKDIHITSNYIYLYDCFSSAETTLIILLHKD